MSSSMLKAAPLSFLVWLDFNWRICCFIVKIWSLKVSSFFWVSSPPLFLAAAYSWERVSLRSVISVSFWDVKSYEALSCSARTSDFYWVSFSFWAVTASLLLYVSASAFSWSSAVISIKFLRYFSWTLNFSTLASMMSSFPCIYLWFLCSLAIASLIRACSS